jgi:hypothetical protein
MLVGTGVRMSGRGSTTSTMKWLAWIFIWSDLLGIITANCDTSIGTTNHDEL